MKTPEIFKSKAITIHVLACVVAGTGLLLARMFDAMIGLLWVIMPVGLVAFLSAFVALPAAIIGGYSAAKDRKFGACVQYGTVCIMSGGIILIAVAGQMITRGRH